MYMQKPLTYSIPEERAVVKAVGDKVVLQTGSQQRSSAHFRQICTTSATDGSANCRKSRSKSPPTGVGHQSNAICVLHHLSMKLDGRKIKWDHEKEAIIGDDEANARLRIPMREPCVL
jgi:hypothetical protein